MKARRARRLRAPTAAYLPDAFVIDCSVCLPWYFTDEIPSLVELNELSASHELTPYDAIYFEFARRRKLPLATLDAALVKAARAAKLPLLTNPSV